MVDTHLSEVQLSNLTLLLTMRDSISRDRVMACGLFGLREPDAQYLSSLSPTQILAIVANVGNETLFAPRNDLFALLQSPLPLAGALCAVHPPFPVRPAATAAPRGHAM
ncbi:hypothetical protein DelCs14_1707 [Delftia sp. Cs1-4]|uniref:hypothetical protein n=1 Tax=Delftia sp. (strain Cs1-4) TaxID=742013 RepID=UPI00020E7A7C|nr:hypothetical protein [Delftia sp. Cs1-4]AEF88736.1 hypothetical protein DelCs14_1707 [Delftia sp. Cs1-4]